MSGGAQFRKVKSIAYIGASRYTGYIAKSIELTLECGHQLIRKASCGVPMKANCRECARMTTRTPEATQ